MASAVTSNIQRGSKGSPTHTLENSGGGAAPQVLSRDQQNPRRPAQKERQPASLTSRATGTPSQTPADGARPRERRGLPRKRASLQQQNEAAELCVRLSTGHTEERTQGHLRRGSRAVMRESIRAWLDRPAASLWCCSPTLCWNPSAIRQEKEIKAQRFPKRKWNIHRCDYTKPRES